ncbi:hypothetical protein [Singulisphaera acidiphila]|uniref:Uncharacterized protein n=1 Tax=Singulisphaera acidiphila (strain ATCC BAA-1392 / DSM 18658 / VKM B-2454 / MOB10) TaxID=886293 RepID=L0DB77_SINAD|nr:hypothetical protein [Singulisphaera acidiphila]AGA26492.1 hypothetical protein Sinac_2165 [Singulisphaera acidiphila DSM 18658]
MSGDVTEAEPAAPPEIVVHYRRLQEKCAEILEQTFRVPGNVDLQAKSQMLLTELEAWAATTTGTPESGLLTSVGKELQYALLAVAQGQYREAFKGLRLVMELTLQTMHLSVNRLELREWLEGRKDTVWGVLMDVESGVLSVRYARAFFPDLEDSVANYRGLAQTLYRECSECVHGNMPQHILVPGNLEFDQESFALWHGKADATAIVLNFALALRFCRELGRDSLSGVETALMDRFGHLPAIRRFFGGMGGE